VGNAMCERVGLARASAGDHQKRTGGAAIWDVRTMLDSTALGVIEFFQIGDRHQIPHVVPDVFVSCN